jgi:tight adherence protein B
MNIQLLSLIMLVLGLWLALMSYVTDFDFFRIEKLINIFSNIKENTLIMVSVVCLGIVVSIITKVFVIAPVSIVMAILLPGILLNQRKIKIQDQKMRQWTLLIDDLTSGVRAGLTISEALAQALQNCEEPLRLDFQEAILEMNRSGQVSKVISILKNQITDTVGVATLKLLQVVMKTGANDLATSLSILSNSSRENHNLIQELKAKQSWVLNGARISVISPWLVLLALWTQESVRNAYQNLIGQLILILVAAVGLFGYLVMKRIGRIEVFRRVETI